MMRMQPLPVLAALFLYTGVVLGEPVASRYELAADGSILRSTEWVLTTKGQVELRHDLAAGSDPAAARAVDVATGKPLGGAVAGGTLVIRLEASLAEGAERRVSIVERLTGDRYLRRGSGLLVFDATLPAGRHSVIFPPGYSLASTSHPVQTDVRDGRVRAGLIVPDGASHPVRLEALAVFGARPDAPVEGSFRADDGRFIVYWLDDPATHKVNLALELDIDRPGQAHVYSVLIKKDNITNARTVDVDRGRELPTRIVTGAEATAIGDSGVTFPADASVLVGDLPAPVPVGGRTRVRLYQTATDTEGYRLDADGTLRYDRFLARLRTRVVLPEGWGLSALDQPATLSRDERGRIVLDFLRTGGDTPQLRITARRQAGGAGR